MHKRIRAVLLIIALIATVVPATASTASAATIRAYAYNWPIQEGSLDVNTAMVSVTGTMGVDSDGSLNSAGTTLSSVSIKETTMGSIGGYDYWIRGISYTGFQQSQKKWRIYAAYRTCVTHTVLFCSNTGYWHFDLTVLDYPWGHPQVTRTLIVNENVWSHVKWS